MENKILTAEEFLIKENLPTDILSGDDINYAMIEFAKLHVEAALKEDSKTKYFPDYELTSKENDRIANERKDYILNAYPLTLIK